jgi:FkbM family methyltransferase
MSGFLILAGFLWILLVPTFSSDTEEISSKCRIICPGKSDYSDYCLCETVRLLSGKATVFSFGIGEDTSFDEAVISTYHVPVYGFDPTPKAISHVKSKNIPNFNFTAKALCAEDKKILLYPPANPNHVSMNTFKRDGAEPLEVDCISILTAMESMDKKEIDVLKLDIEGEEYNLFSNITYIQSLPRVNQILMEIHPAVDSKLILNNLQAAGYLLTYSSNHVYSFRYKRRKHSHGSSNSRRSDPKSLHMQSRSFAVQPTVVNKKTFVENLNGEDAVVKQVVQEILVFQQTLPKGTWLFFQMMNSHYIRLTNNWFGYDTLSS